MSGPACAGRHGESGAWEQGHLQPHRHRGAQEEEVPQAHHHDHPGAASLSGGPPHRPPGRVCAMPASALQHHRRVDPARQRHLVLNLIPEWQFSTADFFFIPYHEVVTQTYSIVLRFIPEIENCLPAFIHHVC